MFEFFTTDKRQKYKEPKEAHTGSGKAHLCVEGEKAREKIWRSRDGWGKLVSVGARDIFKLAVHSRGI